MEPLTLLLASTLISILIAGAALWLGRPWIATSLKSELQREHQQALAALEKRWEARLAELEDHAQPEAEVSAEPDPLVVDARVELCARWVAIGDCIAECGLTRRRSIDQGRFAYRDTFRRELTYFDDYFRAHRAFLDEASVREVTRVVARMKAEERELTGTLRDEQNVDDDEAHRAIVKAFEAMSVESAAVAQLLERSCRAVLQG